MKKRLSKEKLARFLFMYKTALRCRHCGREITAEDIEAYGDRICGRCAIGVALVEGEKEE